MSPGPASALPFVEPEVCEPDEDCPDVSESLMLVSAETAPTRQMRLWCRPILPIEVLPPIVAEGWCRCTDWSRVLKLMTSNVPRRIMDSSVRRVWLTVSHGLGGDLLLVVSLQNSNLKKTASVKSPAPRNRMDCRASTSVIRPWRPNSRGGGTRTPRHRVLAKASTCTITFHSTSSSAQKRDWQRLRSGVTSCAVCL